MTKFDQEKVELVNNSMCAGFQAAGLTVPAAEHDPGAKERRTETESEMRRRKAEEKRQRRAVRR